MARIWHLFTGGLPMTSDTFASAVLAAGFALIFAIGVFVPQMGGPSSISYVTGPERAPSHIMVVRPARFASL